MGESGPKKSSEAESQPPGSAAAGSSRAVFISYASIDAADHAATARGVAARNHVPGRCGSVPGSCGRTVLVRTPRPIDFARLHHGDLSEARRFREARSNVPRSKAVLNRITSPK